MRPVRVTVNAVGPGPWVPIDYVESFFGVGLAVVLSEDASLTYSVQYTLDGITDYDRLDKNVTISRSGTVATVTDPGPLGIGHGLSTNDSVLITGSGSSNLDSPVPALGQTGTLGTPVASTPTNLTYTYTVANSGATADTGNARAIRLRVFPHATLVNQTTRQFGSIPYPVRAVRLNLSIYGGGFADLIVLQGYQR